MADTSSDAKTAAKEQSVVSATLGTLVGKPSNDLVKACNGGVEVLARYVGPVREGRPAQATADDPGEWVPVSADEVASFHSANPAAGGALPGEWRKVGVA